MEIVGELENGSLYFGTRRRLDTLSDLLGRDFDR